MSDSVLERAAGFLSGIRSMVNRLPAPPGGGVIIDPQDKGDKPAQSEGERNSASFREP